MTGNPSNTGKAPSSEQRSAEIIEQALAEKPDAIFLMLSGGNDSLGACHFAAGVLGDRPFHVAHINTGIGIPETRAHVYSVCAQYDWPIKEYRAVHNGQRYEDIVLEHGFPGPAQHLIMFSRLKERALRQLLREHDGTVMLVSGARKQESAKRMRLPDLPVHRDGRKLWCSPFFYLSNEELSAYREKHAIPESPVRKFLCMSGECLCGAFARPGELKEIDLFFPATGQRLRELQARVNAAGFPWGWGERPPAWFQNMKQAQQAGQIDAFADELQMLCTSCNARNEREGQRDR
jgi:3'-phosphoadenosine 5'-phosphosulfate sulfotransferase (PAPS reductase)/FAD synthetase